MRSDVEALRTRPVSVFHTSSLTASLPNADVVSVGALVFTLVGATKASRSLRRLSTLIGGSWLQIRLEPILLEDLIIAVGDEHPMWMEYWTDVFEVEPPDYTHIPDDLVDHLWTAMEENNSGPLNAIVQAVTSHRPTLKDLLNDPRWKLRQRHSSAIIHAVGLAALHDRALDDVLLFSTFLAQAEQPTKADAALFTLETLARQAGIEVVPNGMDDSIPTLLKLNGRGITTLRVSGSEPLSAAMENASPDDTALILHVLEEAETIRTKTGKDDRLDNRHIIAALLARNYRAAVAPYLDKQNFDVPSLRRALLNFIVAEHGESAEAWRAALFVSSSFEMANRIASDVWTYDDALGYRVYAKAIADAILKGATTPPLTIGIQAPWGHGKTSLMRMVQAYLDPDSRTRNDDPPRAAAVTSKYREFLRLLGTPDLLLRAKAWLASIFRRPAESTTVPEPPDTGLIPDRPGIIPTVWFNPLYYRERKQIWAGLAHAILHQLAGQLPSARFREEFWLRLQFARINVDAVRRDVQRLILFRVAPIALLWLVGLTLIAAFSALMPVVTWSFGLAGAAIHALTYANKILKEHTLDRNFEKYVTEPNYAGELGLLHLVDHDLDLALRLLVGKRKIAVFIDDLDRCDPATVNEIVLAINHFLSVQNRKAFFFLGMDMAMVASALEQMHKKAGGFGWRFMEKFVQLPFVIPHLDPETAKTFAMEQLRGTAPAPAAASEVSKVDSIAERVKRAATPSEVGHIAKLAFAAPISSADRARLEESFSSRTTELMADPDSDEIESIARLAVADLQLNPRTIKRYFCLVRVLRNIQIATGAARSPESDRKAILRTAHLLMNWPEFAQWLRDVPQVATGEAWSDSYSEIDGAATKAKSMTDYGESLKKLFGEAAPACVADISLYRFLNKIGNDGPSLSDIYAARLL